LVENADNFFCLFWIGNCLKLKHYRLLLGRQGLRFGCGNKHGRFEFKFRRLHIQLLDNESVCSCGSLGRGEERLRVGLLNRNLLLLIIVVVIINATRRFVLGPVSRLIALVLLRSPAHGGLRHLLCHRSGSRHRGLRHRIEIIDPLIIDSLKTIGLLLLICISFLLLICIGWLWLEGLRPRPTKVIVGVHGILLLPIVVVVRLLVIAGVCISHLLRLVVVVVLVLRLVLVGSLPTLIVRLRKPIRGIVGVLTSTPTTSMVRATLTALVVATALVVVVVVGSVVLLLLFVALASVLSVVTLVVVLVASPHIMVVLSTLIWFSPLI
jgi:hypothetical protein